MPEMPCGPGRQPPAVAQVKRPSRVFDSELAVSPVIATILLVAITVVLAAVLYVMVTGLIGGGGSNSPIVAFGNAVPTATPGVYTIAPSGMSGGCSPSCPLASFKIQLFNTTTTFVPICSTPPVLANTSNLCAGSGADKIKVGFTDSNSNGRLDTNDFFTISNVAMGKSYALSLIWATTGNELVSGAIQG